MRILVLSAILGLLFAVGAALAWCILRLLGRRRHAGKTFKIAALCFLSSLPVLIFLVLPLLFSYFVAHASTRPQDRSSPATPGDQGQEYSEVAFPSGDGLTCRGWYLGGEAGKPAVVLGHGLFRDRREVLERACEFNRAGYPALLFDFRNHGESDPALVSLGYTERMDVLAACQFLREERDQQRFVLFGVSMGAVAAVHAAPELKENLVAVVADSPFQTLEETVARHTELFLGLPPFPFSQVFIWNLTRMVDYRKENLDTGQALQQLHRVPVLLIYGQRDSRLPESTARAIFEAIPHPHKKIVFFESAGHGRAYQSDPERYIKTIFEFLEAPSVSSDR